LSNDGIAQPCEVTVEPYYYYSWVFSRDNFRTEADFEALDAAVEQLSEEVTVNFDLGALESPIELDSPISDRFEIPRLREGIERYFITDINNLSAAMSAQSEIVVMHDGISTDVAHFNHVPGGANVLFLDGHVEYMRWRGSTGDVHDQTFPFPVNDAGILLHEIGEGGGHTHP
jgi:prepilin-type processing-associated H-X9-DG protein